MAEIIPDPEDAAIVAWLNAEEMQAIESRRRVVEIASRMIGALTGSNPGMKPISLEPIKGLHSAPEAIPAVNWKIHLAYELQANEPPEERDPWQFSIVGNLGEYYANRYSDERPSETFNAGFYAGVLAAKHGLVNPEEFRGESDEE